MVMSMPTTPTDQNTGTPTHRSATGSVDAAPATSAPATSMKTSTRSTLLGAMFLMATSAIGPGFINTPLLATAGMTEEVKSSILVPMHPIGRLGSADEVAELAVWLSSDAASFITGGYYPVDGGFLCR